MKILAKRNVLEISPYKPGKPVQEVIRELGISGEVIKLASNENPLGPSKLALKAIERTMGEVNFYPEDGAYYLTQALCKKFGLSEDQLILGNGSVELIWLIALAFVNSGESIVMSDQAFIIYKIVTKVVDGRRIAPPMRNYTHDLEAMAKAVTQDTKVIFIANPNNPTGTMVTQKEVEKFMEMVPKDVLVVFDEAYYEYIERDDYPQTLDYVREGRNVIVLRTFSKIYGLAGLRVGYGMGRSDLIEAVRKVRPPFNVNSLAQEACLAALDDKEHVEKSREINREGIKYLHQKFDEMGLFYTPTVANFVYLDVGFDSQPIFEELQQKGIIVRPIKEYGFPTSFRVTVGLPQQNEKFIQALKKVLAKRKV